VCQRIGNGRKPAEGAMRTLVVVAVPPVFGHAADLIEILEDTAVEDFGPEGLIESLDVGVLGRLARLDMDERDAVPGRPVLQRA